ncbi:MAG TPA: rhodanese-like domain-containing protein [Candidatus Kapabacteria bacterium]|nr:rhodanese-like domain-containing protein [Candidatus Kapabacteria bacterium]
MSAPFEILVEEFKKMLDEHIEHQLIDCRRPDEFQISNIGGTLIEMNSIPQHLNEFRDDIPLVIICRTGSRSAMVTEFLRRNGFPNARNLQGGIYAWNERIDPSIKKY